MLFVFIVSFVLIMVGELADKSQLLALVLATRYRVWQVLLGILIATLTVHLLSAAVGQAIGSLIPRGIIPWVSGLLFIGFGIWTLRGDELDEASSAPANTSWLRAVAAVTAAFFLAELGDKTQIMTVAIAADPGSAFVRFLRGTGSSLTSWLAALGVHRDLEIAPLPRLLTVTLGTSLGMVAADAIAIGLGRLAGKRLPERTLAVASAIIFIVFGVLTIAASYLSG